MQIFRVIYLETQTFTAGGEEIELETVKDAPNGNFYWSKEEAQKHADYIISSVRGDFFAWTSNGSNYTREVLVVEVKPKQQF